MRLRVRDHCILSTLIGGKRQSWSKFASHCAWGTNGVCECEMDVKSTWVPMWHQMDHVSWLLGLFSKPPLGGRPNTKSGDHNTPNARNHWFSLFYHVWKPTWIETHWNSIWLRARSHVASHYTWVSMTTLHDLEVSWDGLWTLSLELSQLRGHGSWLVCDVVLNSTYR
jgi:hypothetical protein